MIIVEGDWIFFEDHIGVIYRVVALTEYPHHADLEVTETDEPDLFPKGMKRENVDLTSANFIGPFVEVEG